VDDPWFRTVIVSRRYRVANSPRRHRSSSFAAGVCRAVMPKRPTLAWLSALANASQDDRAPATAGCASELRSRERFAEVAPCVARSCGYRRAWLQPVWGSSTSTGFWVVLIWRWRRWRRVRLDRDGSCLSDGSIGGVYGPGGQLASAARVPLVSQEKPLEAGSSPFGSATTLLFQRRVTSVSQKFLKMPTRLLVALAPFVLVLAACGDSDDTSSSDTAASTVTDIPRLTFDGSTCVYEGPEEVTAGVVVVELVNDSDGTANVFVGLLSEGKTVQDVIDALGPEPSRGPVGVTPWISDMGGQNPAKAGETMRWDAGLAAGDYVVNCNRRGNVWHGGGFTVVNG
jgi:hypothetical protein